MKVKFSSIKWDTDGRKIKSLPKQVTLEVDNDTDLDMEGADILSDKYGFCVFSFDFETIKL